MRRRVLLPPMPPNPTVAMFTVSLGAWKPRPSTCRGTMVKPAPAAAVVVRNVRLEMSLMESPRAQLRRAEEREQPANFLRGRATPVFRDLECFRILHGIASLRAVELAQLVSEPLRGAGEAPLESLADLRL